MLTAQQIFDTVLTRLREQGQPSIKINGTDIPSCLYRGPNGLKCAVGWLIPDNAYHSKFEIGVGGDSGVVTLSEGDDFAAALSAGGVDVHEHLDLLSGLQMVHDDWKGRDGVFEAGMKQVAQSFNLTYTEVSRG